MILDNKKYLQKIRPLIVRDDIPKDLTVAIESFMKQAVIIGEYELDHMPIEYVENLLQTLARYPEHNDTLMEIVQVLEEHELIEF